MAGRFNQRAELYGNRIDRQFPPLSAFLVHRVNKNRSFRILGAVGLRQSVAIIIQEARDPNRRAVCSLSKSLLSLLPVVRIVDRVVVDPGQHG